MKTHIDLKESRDLLKELVVRLEESLEDTKKLSGLIPICSHCKKVRDADQLICFTWFYI